MRKLEVGRRLSLADILADENDEEWFRQSKTGLKPDMVFKITRVKDFDPLRHNEAGTTVHYELEEERFERKRDERN